MLSGATVCCGPAQAKDTAIRLARASGRVLCLQGAVTPALLLIRGVQHYDEMPLSEREPIVRRRPTGCEPPEGLGRAIGVPWLNEPARRQDRRHPAKGGLTCAQLGQT